jgi:hypothetical protein
VFHEIGRRSGGGSLVTVDIIKQDEVIRYIGRISLVSLGRATLSGKVSFVATVEAGGRVSIAIHLGNASMRLSLSASSSPDRGTSASEIHGDQNVVHPPWRITEGKWVVILWGRRGVPLELSQEVSIVLHG